jgi:hypothetical protein
VRKAIFITIIIIGSVAAGAWYLSMRPGKQNLSPWQLIPNSALAVIETDKPRLLQQLNADSSGLVSVLLNSDTAKTSSTQWLFSVQSLGNKTGIVALIENNDDSPVDFAKKISGVTTRERAYEGMQIVDVNKNNQPWLSAALIRGVWLVSTHSLLIEEIIRSLKTENHPTFRQQHNKLFQLSNVKQDDGNLYINWSAFRNVTSKNQDIDPILKATNLCDDMLFDLRWSGNGSTLLLNGFAADSIANASILSAFRSQKPVAFGFRNKLPDQFRYFVHLGISNPDVWLKERTMLISNNDKIAQQLIDLETKMKFHTTEFFKAIDNELALISLPSGEHLIIAELKEITKAQTELSKINAAHAAAKEYNHESYANEDIHILKNSTLSQTLFWPLSFETSELYYCISNDLLILSDGEQGIKDFIDTSSGDNTLNKSLEWNKFLESTLQESNVSFFVSLANDELFGSLRQPQKFSMQFYPLEGEYYASAVIQFGKQSDKKSSSPKNTKKGTDFGASITSKPWTVKNHNDKSTEVLVVDASNHLHLVSKDQKVLWNAALPGPILGEVHQVDLLKNGKLQYLFATAGQLHAVDRLGRNVAGYPKSISMPDAVYTSLIDYDKSRNYRLLLANNAGKITVVDMDGKPLEGWTSKNLPRNFSDAPMHIRIKQKDYYEATTVDGDVFMFNRKSDINPGFPLALNVNPSGDVVSDGKNLFLVSRDGTFLQVSTGGKKVSENALEKKTPNATFRLVAASNDDNFVVVKTDQGFVAAFDQNGKQLFEINNPASDNIAVSLYHVADKKDALVIFDKDQNIFYACDLSGKMLIAQPVQATALPAVSYSSATKTISFHIPDQTRLVTISASL